MEGGLGRLSGAWWFSHAHSYNCADWDVQVTADQRTVVMWDLDSKDALCQVCIPSSHDGSPDAITALSVLSAEHLVFCGTKSGQMYGWDPTEALHEDGSVYASTPQLHKLVSSYDAAVLMPPQPPQLPALTQSL